MRDYLMVGVIAATVGILLAPLVRRLAAGVGFVDRPDAHHKRHTQPVPLGGGLLIFISAVAGLSAVAVVSPLVRMLIARDVGVATGLLLASLVLVIVGTIDDSKGMRGRHKLVGQLLAALILTSHGLEVQQLELFGSTIDLGVMSVPFSVFWLLGSINAVNLLDGIDGLAGLIGLLTAVLIACVAIISGQPFAALVAVAIAGGCVAFLNVNFPPAKMFLGDTGSMILGLSLGGLTLQCCSNGPGLMSLAPAVGLLALPIMDSGIALLRRRLTGRSIYMTDRGHLHHCLLHALTNHYSVLAVAGAACASSGAGAVLSVYMKNDITAFASTGLVAGILIAMRLFGHVECTLLLRKLAAATIRFRRNGAAQFREQGYRAVAMQLQGERQWNLLWESLVEWAEKLQLLRIVLDVNLPAMKEGFHADWYQSTKREKHECWHVEIPLFVNCLAVGRLQVAGDRSGGEESVCDAVDRLVQLLEPFERAFAELAGSPMLSADASQSVAALQELAGRASVRARVVESLVPSATAEAGGIG